MAVADFVTLPSSMRRGARGIGLFERLREALRRPPAPNQYVAPRLRTIDAVAYVLRGAYVSWTPGSWHDAGVRSVLVAHGITRRHDEVLVEVPTLVPGEAHRIASWISSAKAMGWRFALLQARREIQWVAQARGRKAK